MSFDLTILLRWYAGRRLGRLARLDPVAEQERQLLTLIRRAAATRFGRDHSFARIRSVADFQARVPLRRYDDFWRDYWQPSFPTLRDQTWPGLIPFFALSSGTSAGSTKYIPCSHAINRANTRAGLDLLCHHLHHRPASRVFSGRTLMLGGSTALADLAPGVRSGDLSGIAVKQMPWWAGGLALPPVEVALMADWEQKVERIARLVAGQNVRLVAGTPSWLWILFQTQARLAGNAEVAAAALYPGLDLLVHGGVNFEPYRARFDRFLAGTGAETREVYPASEGFIAVADQGPQDGLRLMIDNGLFFEFVPVEELDAIQPTRHWLLNVVPEINYALVLSSCAGLWSYIIGDTVRFVSVRPPRIKVSGRISYMMSAFGEHLIGEEIDQAVAEAAAAIGAAITDYAVGAVFPEPGTAIGGHLYVVEFAEAVTDRERLVRFASVIDARLTERNDDYRAHRAGGFGLREPLIQVLPPGSFAAWMKSRGRLGGQNKVPRVINDPTLFQALRDFAGSAAP